MNIQEDILRIVEALQNNASSDEDGRAKALTITKLEEAAMWCGRIWPEPADDGEEVEDKTEVEVEVSEEVQNEGESFA